MNSLWITSLVINIKGALLATLIHQWTDRYVGLTKPLGCTHERARIRQYTFNGIGTFHILLATDVVPTLLHLSVFLFFAGLLILLRHISHTVFNAVVGWVVLCVVIYAYITFLPICQPPNPHYAPISSLAWYVYANILYPPLVLPVKRMICNMNVRHPAACLLKRVEEKTEEIILGETPKLDAGILESLALVILCEDGAQEKFFEVIPGFYGSQVVHMQNVKSFLSPTFFTNFRYAVNRFLDQTLSSDSVSELVRSRRLLTCLNATQNVLGDVAGMSIAYKIIRRGNWNEIPPSPEIGHTLRSWLNTTDTDSSRFLIASCMIARIIATAEERDDTWMALARSQLGVTEEVLTSYLEHGDSVLLANLIKTTRLFFEKGLQFEGILRSISGFDVKETLPELQHDFCKLWDEIVEKSKHCGDYSFILDEIHHVHAALHPTAPTAIAALPSSTTANDDSLLLGSSHALCPDSQSHPPHFPLDASRQDTAVAMSSSSSPLGAQSYSPLLQRDETNIHPHLALETPRPSSLDPPSPLDEPPAGIQTAISPPLEHFYSTTTSHTHTTP